MDTDPAAISVADIEDLLASLAFEGGTVSASTRELFMAVARGELTLGQAMDQHTAAIAA